MRPLKGKHGIQALLAASAAVIAVLAQYQQLLPPKAAVVVGALSAVIAAFSEKPGTPKEARLERASQ